MCDEQSKSGQRDSGVWMSHKLVLKKMWKLPIGGPQHCTGNWKQSHGRAATECDLTRWRVWSNSTVSMGASVQAENRSTRGREGERRSELSYPKVCGLYAPGAVAL